MVISLVRPTLLRKSSQKYKCTYSLYHFLLVSLGDSYYLILEIYFSFTLLSYLTRYLIILHMRLYITYNNISFSFKLKISLFSNTPCDANSYIKIIYLLLFYFPHLKQSSNFIYEDKKTLVIIILKQTKTLLGKRSILIIIPQNS